VQPLEELYVSAVSFAEIRFGIELARLHQLSSVLRFSGRLIATSHWI